MTDDRRPHDPAPGASDRPEESDVDLFRLPFQVLATSAEVGRLITESVWSHSTHLTREVLDAARQGRSPGELAGIIADDTLGAIRDSIGIAVDHTPGGQPMLQMTQAAVEQLPYSVRVLFAPLAPDATVKDTRDLLREQGQELLRRSTALDDPDEHPSFRSILAQLAPDEARMIRTLAERGAQPVLSARDVNTVRRSEREVARNVSLLGSESGCIRPQLAPLYLDNLARLGLVHFREYAVASPEAYELLEVQPAITELPPVEGAMTRRRLVQRGVELSQFGHQLYAMCFAPTDAD